MKWCSGAFARRLIVFVIVAIVMLALVSALSPAAFADGGTVPPNLFGMTLGEFLAWLISETVLGAFVAYLLGQFDVPENWRVIIVTVILALASTLVKSLTPFIPPTLLDTRLWDLLMIVIGMLPGWLGLRAGALALVAQTRAAGGLPSATSVKLSGI